jgi:hypothetical protein
VLGTGPRASAVNIRIVIVQVNYNVSLVALRDREES